MWLHIHVHVHAELEITAGHRSFSDQYPKLTVHIALWPDIMARQMSRHSNCELFNVRLILQNGQSKLVFARTLRPTKVKLISSSVHVSSGGSLSIMEVMGQY